MFSQLQRLMSEENNLTWLGESWLFCSYLSIFGTVFVGTSHVGWLRSSISLVSSWVWLLALMGLCCDVSSWRFWRRLFRLWRLSSFPSIKPPSRAVTGSMAGRPEMTAEAVTVDCREKVNPPRTWGSQHQHDTVCPKHIIRQKRALQSFFFSFVIIRFQITPYWYYNHDGRYSISEHIFCTPFL